MFLLSWSLNCAMHSCNFTFLNISIQLFLLCNYDITAYFERSHFVSMHWWRSSDKNNRKYFASMVQLKSLLHFVRTSYLQERLPYKLGHAKLTLWFTNLVGLFCEDWWQTSTAQCLQLNVTIKQWTDAKNLDSKLRDIYRSRYWSLYQCIHNSFTSIKASARDAEVHTASTKLFN